MFFAVPEDTFLSKWGLMIGMQAVASKNGRDVATWTLQFTDDQSCPDPEVYVTFFGYQKLLSLVCGYIQRWWEKAFFIQI